MSFSLGPASSNPNSIGYYPKRNNLQPNIQFYFVERTQFVSCEFVRFVRLCAAGVQLLKKAST